MIYAMNSTSFKDDQYKGEIMSSEKFVEGAKVAKQERFLDKRIMDIFLSIGIPAHLQGYQYLKESVKMVISDPTIINSITKRLYPEVAKIYDTTACRVERGIRHALEVAYTKGRIVLLNELFGVNALTDAEKPTNSEFVALIADRLSLEVR